MMKRELSSIEEQEKLEQESAKEVTGSSDPAVDAASLFDPSALDLLGPSVPLDWVGWDAVGGTPQPSAMSPGSG